MFGMFWTEPLAAMSWFFVLVPQAQLREIAEQVLVDDDELPAQGAV